MPLADENPQKQNENYAKSEYEHLKQFSPPPLFSETENSRSFSENAQIFSNSEENDEKRNLKKSDPLFHPLEFKENPQKAPGPTQTAIKDAKNRYLNRKLNHWAKLRQVGSLNKPSISDIKPSRTFELLELAKNISQKACPKSYLSSLFLDQAVDLFVVLHQGRDYRYSEDLEEKNYLWIQSILGSCYRDIEALNVYTESAEFDSTCRDRQRVSLCGKLI